MRDPLWNVDRWYEQRVEPDHWIICERCGDQEFFSGVWSKRQHLESSSLICSVCEGIEDQDATESAETEGVES